MHTKSTILAAIEALPVEPEISADALYLGYSKPDGFRVRLYRIDSRPGQVALIWSLTEPVWVSPERAAEILLSRGYRP